MAKIADLFRYPIKGLTPEPLDAVTLETGACLPLDRVFALARPDAPFDPAAPRWLPKTNFLMLMRDEQLARLRAAYDGVSRRLTIEENGERVLDANLATAAGRERAEAFFEAYMDGAVGGRPRLVDAPGHVFTDSAARYVSIINLATVRDIERVAGRPVHPLRFRANLYVEDLPAWAEFDWVGREVAIEGGEARFRVARPIQRCAATAVDPETAKRDLNVPLTLRRHFGHIDCGVYLEVIRGGTVARGQTLATPT